jgi:hypothetical protein
MVFFSFYLELDKKARGRQKKAVLEGVNDEI